MAKIKLGALAHQVSGSIGGQVYSHNRYGAYIRARTIPTKVDNPATALARATLGGLSEGWGGLTAAQRLAWSTWAQTHPITDRLGDRQVLSGIAAFVQLNARILRCGDTPLSDPPIIESPIGPTSCVLEADIGTGDFEIVFAPTPCEAGVRIWVWAALVDSEAITYVRNLRRLIVVSDAAKASPVNIAAEMAAKFGTLQVGQVCHVAIQAVDGASGLTSPLVTDFATIIESA